MAFVVMWSLYPGGLVDEVMKYTLAVLENGHFNEVILLMRSCLVFIMISWSY